MSTYPAPLSSYVPPGLSAHHILPLLRVMPLATSERPPLLQSAWGKHTSAVLREVVAEVVYVLFASAGS